MPAAPAPCTYIFTGAALAPGSIPDVRIFALSHYPAAFAVLLAVASVLAAAFCNTSFPSTLYP